MPFLIAAVVVLTVLCLLNLLLTFGIVRKLRAQRDHSRPGPAALVLPVGSTAPNFSAVTTTGETITREGLGETLFGFFSPNCPACTERLPRFVEAARRESGRRALAVLAVLHGDDAATRAQAAALRDVARVVVEASPDGPLGTAFAITGYPAFGLIDAHGTVTATGLDPERLTTPDHSTT
ncbi:TlpA family protein disulfide reductase [Embleya sp. NPDC056575]|uniref:TlpA family protein disulfide reductase n=1 Tax=unclassified Embleya TaxID=2699296 RepID=UPI0036AF6983